MYILSILLTAEDGMDEIKENLTQDNAVSTLKELAESGRCSIPQYELPDEQVFDDGEYWWSCTCYVRSWSIQKTALSKSKKGAKRYAAYLVLCDFFGMEPDEE